MEFHISKTENYAPLLRKIESRIVQELYFRKYRFFTIPVGLPNQTDNSSVAHEQVVTRYRYVLPAHEIQQRELPKIGMEGINQETYW